MRAWIFALALLMTSGCSSCGKSEPPAPVKPPPPKPVAGICDVHLDSPPAHACTEIYDPELLPESEHWCNEMKSAKDTAVFTKNAACPVEGQISACRMPSGSVEFSYAPSTVARAQFTCGNHYHGQFVADTTLPEAGSVTVYSCMLTKSKLAPIDGTCLEEESVVDLAMTASKQNCLTINGTFDVAPCPTANAIGRCISKAHQVKATRVFYGNKHDAGAAHAVCDQIAGEFKE